MALSVVNSDVRGFDAAGASYSFDAGSGSNRLLVAVWAQNDGDSTSAAPTYNGVSMTQFINYNSTNWGRLTAWYLIAPATGSNTFAINAASGTPDFGVALIAYQDAHQTDPVPDTKTGQGSTSSGSLTVTTSYDNMLLSLVLSFDGAGSASFNASGGSTKLTEGIFGSGAGDYDGAAFSKAAATAGNNSIAWSSANAELFAHIAWAVRPVAGVLSVTTEAVSSIANRTATGNGTIASDGGNTPTRRGFAVSTTTHTDPGNTDPDVSDYELVFDESGSYSTGAYTLSLTGLSPETTYYVRAFAQTSAGFAYGSEVNFTTLADPLFSLSPSANIAASGEATTAQLTAPSGKTTGDFTAGRIQDDENPADSINIGSDGYTEVEFSIEATTYAENAATYEFRITRNGTVLDTYTVTPELTISSGVEEASVSPVVLTLTLPTVTATYESVQTADITPVTLTLSLPEVIAASEQVEAASVSPVTLTLTLPSVTATYSVGAVASVSPVVLTLSVPEVIPTYEAIATASVTPVVLNASIPPVTATYEQVNTATVSPVVMTLAIPTVTATYEQANNAITSPVVMTLSLPEVVATYEAEYTASLTPLTLTLALPPITATYVHVVTASVSPVALTLTLPEVTATYSSGTVAAVSPVLMTLSLPVITATYESSLSASVEPVELTLSLPQVTATFDSIQTASVSPVVLALTLPSVTATYTSGTVASVQPVVLALTLPTVTATYVSVVGAGIEPVGMLLTLPVVTATYQEVVEATVSPLVITLSLPSVTADYSEAQIAVTSPIVLTLSPPIVTAEYESVLSASVSPVVMTLTLPRVRATSDADEEVEEEVISGGYEEQVATDEIIYIASSKLVAWGITKKGKVMILPTINGRLLRNPLMKNRKGVLPRIPR